MSLIQVALRDELLATFHDEAYQPPPLSKVALEVYKMARRMDVQVADIVRVLETDQMLAASTMRLVSSPVYGGQGRIKSLHQAVVRLGFKTLCDVVFEAALTGSVFNVPEYSDVLEQIRHHSIAAAHLTGVVCEEAGVHDDGAFLCGLLHDIGLTAQLLAISKVEGSGRPLVREVWREVDNNHARASGLVARLWRLPDEMCVLLAEHHGPFNEKLTPVAAAVCMADALSGRFGASIVGPIDETGEPMEADSMNEQCLAAARERLGLDVAAVKRIAERAEATIEELNRGS